MEIKDNKAYFIMGRIEFRVGLDRQSEVLLDTGWVPWSHLDATTERQFPEAYDAYTHLKRQLKLERYYED